MTLFNVGSSSKTNQSFLDLDEAKSKTPLTATEIHVEMRGEIEALCEGLQLIKRNESSSFLNHSLIEKGVSESSKYSKQSKKEEATERMDPAVFSLFGSMCEDAFVPFTKPERSFSDEYKLHLTKSDTLSPQLSFSNSEENSERAAYFQYPSLSLFESGIKSFPTLLHSRMF